MLTTARPTNLKELRDSGWESRSVKQEIRDNLLAMLGRGETLFPGIIGYDATVIPEINIALLAGHDRTATTESVYRHEIRPALTQGAEVMDKIFG